MVATKPHDILYVIHVSCWMKHMGMTSIRIFVRREQTGQGTWQRNRPTVLQGRLPLVLID